MSILFQDGCIHREIASTSTNALIARVSTVGHVETHRVVMSATVPGAGPVITVLLLESGVTADPARTAGHAQTSQEVITAHVQ